jgi:hypothetical protein
VSQILTTTHAADPAAPDRTICGLASAETLIGRGWALSCATCRETQAERNQRAVRHRLAAVPS